MIVLLKAAHLSLLVIWCGGLLCLPLMLARQDENMSQREYTRARRYTHFTYTIIVTPAAVAAIISGTWLIFLGEIYDLWLFAKLIGVLLLVAGHAWIGNSIVRVAETAGSHKMPAPRLTTAALLVPMLLILFLVLSKPALTDLPVPDWLREPYGGEWPAQLPD
jgi:protoporphyrinogen IX oxidase